MKPGRFEALWIDGSGASLRDRMTREELADVFKEWDTLGGDSNWMDAFHTLWRKTDPDGHRARFRGTFYETAATMRADDDEES